MAKVRVLTLLPLAIIIAILAAACSGPATTPPAPAASKPATSAPTASSAPASPQAKQVTTWLWSGSEYANLGQAQYINYEMPKIIEQATNGQLKIEYRVGLYSPDARLEPLIQNKIQIAWENPSNFTAMVPEWKMSHIPFLIQTEKEFYDFFDGPGFDMYYKNVSDKYKQNLFTSFCWSNGCDGLWSKKLVSSVSDFKGMKIVGDALSRRAIDLLGGTGTSIPFAEIYLAIERGVVDGSLIGSMWGLGRGYQDAAKFYANWPFISNYPMNVQINATALNSLAPDVKKALIDTLESTVKPRMRQLAKTDVANAGPQALKAKGVTWTDLDPAEVAKAAKATAQIVNEWVKEAPECLALVKKFEQVTGRKILE